MALNLNKRPGESDEAYYRRLSKSADQRLVRIEAQARTEIYKEVRGYAYATAQRDIATTLGSNGDRLRFNKKIIDTKTLKKMTRNVIKFLESESSTVGKTKMIKDGQEVIQEGIKGFYQKRADKINDKYGTNYTWDNLANYFEKVLPKIQDRVKGSATQFITIGTIQKSKLLANDYNDIKSSNVSDLKKFAKDKKKMSEFEKRLAEAERKKDLKLIADIQESIRSNLKFSNDAVVNDAVKKVLYESDLKLSDLY